MAKTYKYGDYGITPTARQLRNTDGSNEKWGAHADIHQANNDADLLAPYDWDNKFDSEEDAKRFALGGAIFIIDSGQCKI